MIWLKGIIEFVFEMVSMINTFMYMNFTTGIQLLEFFWEKCFKFPQALEIMKIIFFVLRNQGDKHFPCCLTLATNFSINFVSPQSDGWGP